MLKKSNPLRLQRPHLYAGALLICVMSISQASDSDWRFHSYDQQNTNHNPTETQIDSTTSRFLKRSWETFNDDALVSEAAPTGFALAGPLGLQYRSPVVGVVASPIVIGDTIYYVDQLGTVFSRNAQTGTITDPGKHWTTVLSDPDFDNGNPPIAPELYYTAPVVTDTHIWLIGSFFGGLHAVELDGGAEIDFNPSTPATDPFRPIPEFPLASVLGDSVIVRDQNRELFITNVNVIVNDAVVQGGQTGVQLALDISNPNSPIERWRRFSLEADANGNRLGSGVSIGAGLAVDPYRPYLYGGTGQNTSVPYAGYPDPAQAPDGFIDRSDSVYAINYRTGEFVWHNQFHNGDVFDLNNPVSTGPNQQNGPRDADVLSPPVLWSSTINGNTVDLVGVGSKGGLYRAVNRATGATVWERQISKPTGIGGIQAGSAFADGIVYVAGFEGLNNRFSDAQFGFSLESGLFPNAFFATFSPAFWADVEDVSNDGNPATGMRIKVYALDARTGESVWKFNNGRDFAVLREGAALRHVSVANDLIYVTTTSGKLIILDRNGRRRFEDQTLDLNAQFGLGLGKPMHASMNTGALISNGRVYVGYGAQNEPSGGIIAYELDTVPAVQRLTRLQRRDQRLFGVRFSLRGAMNQLLIVLSSTVEDGPTPSNRVLLDGIEQWTNQARSLGDIDEEQTGILLARITQIRNIIF